MYAEDVENFGDELIHMKYFLESDDRVLDPISLFRRLLNLQVCFLFKIYRISYTALVFGFSSLGYFSQHYPSSSSIPNIAVIKCICREVVFVFKEVEELSPLHSKPGSVGCIGIAGNRGRFDAVY